MHISKPVEGTLTMSVCAGGACRLMLGVEEMDGRHWAARLGQGRTTTPVFAYSSAQMKSSPVTDSRSSFCSRCQRSNSLRTRVDNNITYNSLIVHKQVFILTQYDIQSPKECVVFQFSYSKIHLLATEAIHDKHLGSLGLLVKVKNKQTFLTQMVSLKLYYLQQIMSSLSLSKMKPLSI